MVENANTCSLLADLQAVHGFRCYDSIARTRNVSDCLYTLYAWLHFAMTTFFGDSKLILFLLDLIQS